MEGWKDGRLEGRGVGTLRFSQGRQLERGFHLVKADDYLPLTETSFFILLSLATAPKHGYGIIKEVETLSAGRVVLAAGTLYSALRRMLEGKNWEKILNSRRDPGCLGCLSGYRVFL